MSKESLGTAKLPPIFNRVVPDSLMLFTKNKMMHQKFKYER